MILPGSLVSTLIVLAFGVLCWGLWMNTLKMVSSKWRYELYYFDFAAAAFVISVIAAFTVGTMGWDGFQFTDDITGAGRRQDAFALGAGIIFNLGNMLLLGSVPMVGLTIAAPVGFGAALITASLANTFTSGSGVGSSLMFVILGVLLLIAAIVFSVLAFSGLVLARQQQAISAGKTKSTKKGVNRKGIVTAVIGGILTGAVGPIIENARASENGLGPYSIGFLFTAGLLISTFVFNLFLMNLPLQGEPIDFGSFFRGKLKNHILGWVGGALWAIGLIATLVAARTEGNARPSDVLRFGLPWAAPVVATLCGLFVWKEFSDTDSRTMTFVSAMLVLLVAGITIVTVGPVISPK